MVANGEGDLETRIEAELEEQLAEDVAVAVYRQGDSLDVQVDFPTLEDSLSDAIGDGRVQPYSSLKFTVSQR